MGLNISPFHFKNEHNLPKVVRIFPNFLVLYFGKKNHENRNKNTKLTDAWKFALKCE